MVNKLRQEEEKLWPVLGHRVKLVERCGTKLKSLLWNADPLGGLDCDDDACPICSEEGGRPICMVKNAIYTNTCKECLKEGRQTKYVGETSRTVIERAKEHARDRLDYKKSSHMRDHATDDHPGREVTFRFDLLKRCTTPLERQVGESINIKLLQKQGVKIINIKIEFNRCILPSLLVIGGMEKEKDKKEKEEKKASQNEEKSLMKEYEQTESRVLNKREREEKDEENRKTKTKEEIQPEETI